MTREIVVIDAAVEDRGPLRQMERTILMTRALSRLARIVRPTSRRNAIGLLFLAMLTCAPVPAAAQDCSASESAYRSAQIRGGVSPKRVTREEVINDIWWSLNGGASIQQICPPEWRARCKPIAERRHQPTDPNSREALLLFADISERRSDAVDYRRWQACLARQLAAQLSPKPTSGHAGKAAPSSPAPSVTATRPSSSGSAGTASPGAASAAAANGAQQRQAALDEQRRNRPKRHYAEREAHRCLTLIKATDNTLYGGFINTCDFPVRFSYCAYKPKRGSWTEAFNCEEGTGKLGGHALIKPHERSAHHTLGAEKIFWFACRADSSSDEIFEVGDAAFDPNGPGIRARCVKWGDRS